jgi:hypothetical protein
MWIIFPYIGNVIIPIDFHIFQRGWLNHQPEGIMIPLFMALQDTKIVMIPSHLPNP